MDQLTSMNVRFAVRMCMSRQSTVAPATDVWKASTTTVDG